MINNQRVVLVTGASSGIGKCCAEFLAKQGYRVYGASRRVVSTDTRQRSSNANLFQMMMRLTGCNDLPILNPWLSSELHAANLKFVRLMLFPYKGSLLADTGAREDLVLALISPLPEAGLRGINLELAELIC